MRKGLITTAVLLLLALSTWFVPLIPWRVHITISRKGENVVLTPEVKAQLESLVKHQVEELKFTINETIVTIYNPGQYKFDVKDALSILHYIESQLRKIRSKRT